MGIQKPKDTIGAMRQTKIILEGEDTRFVRDIILTVFKQKGFDVELKADNLIIVKMYGD